MKPKYSILQTRLGKVVFFVIFTVKVKQLFQEYLDAQVRTKETQDDVQGCEIRVTRKESDVDIS